MKGKIIISILLIFFVRICGTAQGCTRFKIEITNTGEIKFLNKLEDKILKDLSVYPSHIAAATDIYSEKSNFYMTEQVVQEVLKSIKNTGKCEYEIGVAWDAKTFSSATVLFFNRVYSFPYFNGLATITKTAAAFAISFADYKRILTQEEEKTADEIFSKEINEKMNSVLDATLKMPDDFSAEPFPQAVLSGLNRILEDALSTGEIPGYADQNLTRVLTRNALLERAVSIDSQMIKERAVPIYTEPIPKAFEFHYKTTLAKDTAANYKINYSLQSVGVSYTSGSQCWVSYEELKKLAESHSYNFNLFEERGKAALLKKIFAGASVAY